MKNFKMYATDYYGYISMLSSGDSFKILISKRLLFRTVSPMWFLLFGIFLVQSSIFFAMVGLPSMILFFIFLVKNFSLWQACGFSAKAYIVFHCGGLLFLKMFSIPISILLEVLWTSCF